MVWRLNDDTYEFPDPHFGDDDGLIAVGGDLSPDRLIEAYSNGIFPWYGFKENDDILWWCPLDRFVIFSREIHISRSMHKLMKKGTYTVTLNIAFREVIENCSKAQDRHEQEGAWLGEEMIEAYCKLHEMGFAVSAEVWDKKDNLVGGIYGINLGRHFFGESMFSLAPSASKLALIRIAQELQQDNGIIDCQFETPHLKSMGGRHITYDEYMDILSL